MFARPKERRSRGEETNKRIWARTSVLMSRLVFAIGQVAVDVGGFGCGGVASFPLVETGRISGLR